MHHFISMSCILLLDYYYLTWCLQRLQALWNPAPDFAYDTSEPLGKQQEL